MSENTLDRKGKLGRYSARAGGWNLTTLRVNESMGNYPACKELKYLTRLKKLNSLEFQAEP